MSDLTRAAEALRASVAALRQHQHDVAGPWRARAGGVVADDGTDVGMLVVEPYYQPPADDEIIDHIARTASPDVVTALADLLTALHCLCPEPELTADEGGPDPLDYAHRAAHAAAAAILREPS